MLVTRGINGGARIVLRAYQLSRSMSVFCFTNVFVGNTVAALCKIRLPAWGGSLAGSATRARAERPDGARMGLGGRWRALVGRSISARGDDRLGREARLRCSPSERPEATRYLSFPREREKIPLQRPKRGSVISLIGASPGVPPTTAASAYKGQNPAHPTLWRECLACRLRSQCAHRIISYLRISLRTSAN